MPQRYCRSQPGLASTKPARARPVRMAHKTADKLVYCHEAMHVQLRMQDAGWSADVERHESDEDSDDSATGRDADERAAGNLSESAILRLMM